MQDIVLNSAGGGMSDRPTLVIGDEPAFKNGELVVYELVSNFEEIKVHFGNRLS